MRQRFPAMILVLAASLLGVPPPDGALAQTMQAELVSSAGGTVTGSGFTLISSLGQPTAGRTNGSPIAGRVGFWYVVEDEEMSSGVSNDNRDQLVPAEVSLGQVYPNPTWQTSTIRYDLPQPARVRMEVFDVQGRHVMLALDAVKPAGRHTSTLDAAHLSSGTYIVRVETEDFGDIRVFHVVR